MKMLYFVIAVMAVLAALDRIFGNKIGFGKEFERGIFLMGTMMLSMTGMLVLAPCIAHVLQGLDKVLPSFIDPSAVSSMFLACDMGGAPLALEICREESMGLFNGMLVAGMLGATISFTIPISMEMVPKRQHRDLLFGLLCGIVTIPIGCLVGGLIAGVPFFAMLMNLVPTVLLSGIIALGLLKKPDLCVKILSWLGVGVNALITIGLAAGVFEFLTGIKLIPYTDSIENATGVVLNCACVMAGMFPLIWVLSKVLNKPLKAIGKKLDLNETSMMGIPSSLASNVNTFPNMPTMDRKGVVLNSAFAVSGAFTFAGHLGFTLAFWPEYLVPMIVGKLTAGLSALVLAYLLSRDVPGKSGMEEE